MSPVEKRKFYWHQFKLDPKLTAWKAKETRSEEVGEARKRVKGWMTVDQILALNGIGEQHPRRALLGQALCEACPERPHHQPAMAALGEKEWYYIHEGHTEEVEAKHRRIEVQGQADLDEEAYEQVTKQIQGPSSSSNQL